MSFLSRLMVAIIAAVAATAMVTPGFATEDGPAKPDRIVFPKGETRLVISDPAELPKGLRVVLDRLRCRYEEPGLSAPVEIIRLSRTIIALANCPQSVFSFPVLMIYRGRSASEEPRILDLPQITSVKRGFSSKNRQPGFIEWDKVPGALTITFHSDMIPSTSIRHVYEYNGHDDFILIRIETGELGGNSSAIAWETLWEAPEWRTLLKR